MRILMPIPRTCTNMSYMSFCVYTYYMHICIYTEYVKVKGVENAITGQLNTATRTSINKEYFEHMHNSRIIVTVNPAW